MIVEGNIIHGSRATLTYLACAVADVDGTDVDIERRTKMVKEEENCKKKANTICFS